MKTIIPVLCLIPLWLYPHAPNLPLQQFELNNGLKVIVSPQKNMEATAICLYFFNGARNDPADMPGTSYFFQDLMFMGTANLEAYDQVLFVNQKAGRIGGEIGYDNSFFYQVISANEIDLALRYESERLQSLRLGNPEIEQRKKQILHQINQSDNSIQQNAQNWVMQRLFKDSPYERPLWGESEKIPLYPPERIREYYKHYQNPSNFLLIISGKADVNELKNTIQHTFSSLPGGFRSRASFSASSAPIRGPILKNWTVEGPIRPFVVYGFSAPSRLDINYFYLLFLLYYFSDHRNSQLAYMCQQVNRLNIDIKGTLTRNFEANALILELTADNNRELEKAKFIFESEIKSLHTNPINVDIVRSLKNMMELDFCKNIHSPENQCRMIGEHFQMFGTLDYFSSYVSNIRKIDIYSIQNTAKKYLNRTNQIILNVYSRK